MAYDDTVTTLSYFTADSNNIGNKPFTISASLASYPSLGLFSESASITVNANCDSPTSINPSVMEP